MLSKLFLTIASVTITVLLVELILHAAFALGWFPNYPAIMTRLEKVQYAEYVSEVQFTDNVPHNSRGYRTFTQRGIPRQLIEFSEDGMRLDGYDGPADCRVGIFGDSFAEALQVGQGDDFSSLTESVLREAGYSVNFQNFGHGGDGTTVQYLRYRQLVDLGYKFDEVYLFFYPGNDVANNKRELNRGESGRYPYFVLEEGELKRADAEGTGLKSSRMWDLREILAKYSHISNLVMNVRTELIVIPELRSVTDGAFASRPDKDWEEAWTVTEKVLETWSRDASSRGSRFVVFILTAMSQLTDKFRGSEDFDETYPNRRLKEFATEHNIELIDFLPIAKQYIRDHNLKFPYLSWTYDGHYSQVGHRLVSNTLVEHFRGNSGQCGKTPAPDRILACSDLDGDATACQANTSLNERPCEQSPNGSLRASDTPGPYVSQMAAVEAGTTVELIGSCASAH